MVAQTAAPTVDASAPVAPSFSGHPRRTLSTSNSQIVGSFRGFFGDADCPEGPPCYHPKERRVEPRRFSLNWSSTKLTDDGFVVYGAIRYHSIVRGSKAIPRELLPNPGSLHEKTSPAVGPMHSTADCPIDYNGVFANISHRPCYSAGRPHAQKSVDGEQPRFFSVIRPGGKTRSQDG